MSEPFVLFAKAYVRYMHGMRPTKTPELRVTALRALDAAFILHILLDDPFSQPEATLQKSGSSK